MRDLQRHPAATTPTSRRAPPRSLHRRALDRATGSLEPCETDARVDRRGRRRRRGPLLGAGTALVALGSFPPLEDQQCDYDPTVSALSPDRMDALVWGVSDLMEISGAEAGLRFLQRQAEQLRAEKEKA